MIVFNIVDSVLAVLIGYYGICGYRKPHGNLLKYVILIYAFFFLFRVYVLAVQGDVRQAVISAAVIGFCCYIAGRLHKVKQNTILMGIVAVLLVIATIGRFAVTKTTLGVYSILILWIDICVAYILRFKEHKEAGLIDKVEK